MRVTSLRLSLYVVAALATPLVTPARAQVGATTDIIMGRVRATDTSGVEGARVEVTSTETGITRRKSTNAHGDYSVLFPDGGGSYRVRVTLLGYAPFSGAISRQADEDRLVLDVRLTRNPQVLAAVTVRAATRAQGAPDRATAGSTGRTLSAAELDRLPVDKGDLASIATLTPGVIGTAGTDSTASSFSVGGQPTNQNQITLDGLSFGSGSVPSEAVRSTRVITSTYDVSRGQFTGGQVASTTRGGTNNVQGVASYALRDPALEFIDESSSTFGQRYLQNSLNLGAGGPLREDELFVFGAASVSRRTNPLPSLLAASNVTLARLGTNPDSVQRFLDRLATLGVGATLPRVPSQRLADQASALLRLDWSLGELHTLTLRGDWHGAVQDGTRVAPLAVPTTGGDLRSEGGGALATLTSHVGRFINEARVYQASDRQNTDPYLMAPIGRVTVASILESGAQGITSLQFGGNPSLPQDTHSRLLEATDEVSWVSAGGAHRYKLGGLLNDDRSTVGSIPNRFGTFTYGSLQDFENDRPSQFTRTLAGRDRLAGSDNAAVYAGDAWRYSPALQLVYGVRAEGSRFPRTPDYSADVERAFARRTDVTPAELSVSPRIGFTYFTGMAPAATTPDGARATAGGPGGPGGPGGFGGPAGFDPDNWVLRGGVGEFRGRVPSSLVASAVEGTGLAGGQTQLSCIGAAVPVPDWSRFLADPTSIPTECQGGGSVDPIGAGQRRNVVLFGDGFAAPKVWRASLGAGRRYLERYSLNVDASVAYGIQQTGSRDINLDTVPKFLLAREANRPVYAPMSSIVGRTGVSSINASRLHPEFGSVSELTSQLRSRSTQVTTTLAGLTLQGLRFSASYTYLRASDQQNGFGVTGGGFAGPNTGGNPNAVAWGTSDFERRHSVLATLTVPAANWLDITAIGRITAGQRYTPLANGDINGDGSRNDRAFVFDPSDPALQADTALANGMRRVLEGASPRARECLASQLGGIAARNSCSTPDTPALDVQLNFKPAALGLDRRLTLSLQLQNALVGIDQLLHGSDDLRGWGQPLFPDRTLLFVRGFDHASGAYRYQVNEHFGTTSGRNSPFRIPFQIGLQGRLALGSDPARQQVRQLFAGTDGRPPTREEYIARMSRLVPNPFRQTLALDDSLRLALTPQQKLRLAALGDSLAPRSDRLVGDIADMLIGAGSNPDPMVIFARMSAKTAEARRLAEQAIADLRTTLTPAQFAQLPASVRTPPSPRGVGGFGGGGGERRVP